MGEGRNVAVCGSWGLPDSPLEIVYRWNIVEGIYPSPVVGLLFWNSRAVLFLGGWRSSRDLRSTAQAAVASPRNPDSAPATGPRAGGHDVVATSSRRPPEMWACCWALRTPTTRRLWPASSVK